MSYWVRNTKMTPDYYKRINSLVKNNIWKAQAVNKQNLAKRLKLIRSKNISLIKEINLSVGKLILSTLYWCEGCKYPSTKSLKFGNSDPHMIKLFIALLRRCYQIDETKFRLTLQCLADQQQSRLLRFWGDTTQIPITQHYKPRTDKRSVDKPTYKPGYKGVCVIEYFDVNLQCRATVSWRIFRDQSSHSTDEKSDKIE